MKEFFYDFPLKNKKRALRRFYKLRKLEKAKRIGRRRFFWVNNYDEICDKVDHWAHRHADNLKSVKCLCCGNPRKYLKKKTLAEKKIEQSEKEQFKEYQQQG